MPRARLVDVRQLTVLPQDFYDRSSVVLARALLGQVLVHETEDGVTAGRIVEVEAYRGVKDRAAHTFGGRRTPRNESMWGPPGHAYVYFVYGMHWCVNAVAGPPGVPEAVLLRALEPVAGIDLIRARRQSPRRDERLLSGPANLCKGLGIDRALNGVPLFKGDLTIRKGPLVPARQRAQTPRIGVDYAGEDALKAWRFYVRGSPAVSGTRPRL